MENINLTAALKSKNREVRRLARLVQKDEATEDETNSLLHLLANEVKKREIKEGQRTKDGGTAGWKHESVWHNKKSKK